VDEGAWLAEADPVPMLDLLGAGASPRKLRLFAVACCRALYPLLFDPRSQRAIEVAERHAEGLSGAVELAEAAEAARVAHIDARHGKGGLPTAARAVHATCAPEAQSAALTWAAEPFAAHALEARRARPSLRALLLRDIFGNPFRPLPPRPFPAHVVGLAQACYNAFPAVSEQFLVLADAMEDLGEWLAAEHCREATHARGCHVLDWVLDKE
jgi:hypothetical protein